MDLLRLYDQASGWALEKVAGATGELDAPTPCEGWDVRTLLNHMLETQHYFLATGRGRQGTLSATPPELISDGPANDFATVRDEIVVAFAAPGVLDQTGPLLGIAAADQLLHGWDLSIATGQIATMPMHVADAVYGVIHGRFTDAERQGVFKPEVPIGPDADAQERLLAYTGRDPR